MVVILLLPPYSTNGCDGRSNESSSTATSTTSTGETAIPNISYQHSGNNNWPPTTNKSLEDHNNNNQQTSSYYYTARPPTEFYECTNTAPALSQTTASHYQQYPEASISPPPPPLPKSKPPKYIPPSQQSWQQQGIFDIYDQQNENVKLCANIVPKPPRCRSLSQQTLETIPEHTPPPQPTQPPPPATVPFNPAFHKSSIPKASKSKSFKKNSNYITNTTNYVRHVTRVNFYDIDTSQVEYESKDYDADDDNLNLSLDDERNTEALTKEGKFGTKLFLKSNLL